MLRHYADAAMLTPDFAPCCCQRVFAASSTRHAYARWRYSHFMIDATRHFIIFLLFHALLYFFFFAFSLIFSLIAPLRHMMMPPPCLLLRH